MLSCGQAWVKEQVFPWQEYSIKKEAFHILKNLF